MKGGNMGKESKKTKQIQKQKIEENEKEEEKKQKEIEMKPFTLSPNTNQSSSPSSNKKVCDTSRTSVLKRITGSRKSWI